MNYASNNNHHAADTRSGAETGKAARVLSHALLGVLLLSMLFLLYKQATIGGCFVYDQFSDRDLFRSAGLLTDFPTTGAELGEGTGARIPGGAMYYLWAIPLLISDSPAGVYLFQVILHICATFLLFWILYRHYGLTEAVFGTCVYLGSVMFIDILNRLWNPGFLPLFVMLAYVFFLQYILDDRRGALKWFFGAVLVAMQMHLSAVILVFPALVWLLIFRRRLKNEPWRDRLRGAAVQVGMCLLVMALVMLPHIVDEVINGFGNSRLLLAQPQVAAAHNGPANSTANWLNLVRMLEFLAGNGLAETGKAISAGAVDQVLLFGLEHSVFLLIVLFGLVIAVSKVLGKDVRGACGLTEEQSQAMLFCMLVIVVGALVYMLSNVPLQKGAMRYAFFTVPAFAVLGGAVVGVVGKMLLRRAHPIGYALLLTVLTGGLVLQMCHSAGRAGGICGLGSYSGFMGLLKSIQNETGWTIRDISGKLLVLQAKEDGRWQRALKWPVDYELLRRGYSFPGSLDPPGGVYLLGALSHGLQLQSITEEFLARTFNQSVPGLKILDKKTFRNNIFVVYTRDGGKVFTSLTNRYNATREERLIVKYKDSVPKETAREVENKPRKSSFVVNLDNVVYTYVTMEQVADGTSVMLHSNQLRGFVPNEGWFASGMIDRPTLVFINKAVKNAVPVLLYGALVGDQGVFTPLEKRGIALNPGDYEIRLQTWVVKLDNKTWPMRETKRTQLDLVLGHYRVEWDRTEAKGPARRGGGAGSANANDSLKRGPSEQ